MAKVSPGPIPRAIKNPAHSNLEAFIAAIGKPTPAGIIVGPVQGDGPALSTEEVI